MKEIAVKTQVELEAAIKAGNIAVCVEGEFNLSISGTDAPHIILHAKASLYLVARGSSQPRVEARESSQPRVEAWGSSQPRVVAWGSSQPRVEARESSQPRVVAWGYVQLSIFGKVAVTASKLVAILAHGIGAKIKGGHTTKVKIDTPRAWCDYYGVAVARGVAILFKAVREDYHSPHGADYSPGGMPIASDWDGGKKECGGGLHFSPSPKMALEFFEDAKKFIACPVAIKDMRAPQPSDDYPQKIKAKGCCGPTSEVNDDGEAVQ